MKKRLIFPSVEEARKHYPWRPIKALCDGQAIVLQQDQRYLEPAAEECTFCDKCGKEICDEHGNFEGMSICLMWGYSSNKDLECHSLDLCEKCYDEHILSTVQKFGKIEEYM